MWKVRTMLALRSLAWMGAAMLSGACQLPDPGPFPCNCLLSAADSNAICTGGYWFTYADHNDETSPFHASVSPLTGLTIALKPTKDDAAHGTVIRVSGSVPPGLPAALISAADPSIIDKHWQAIYPDSEIPAEPAAGVGFGFKNFNSPFDGSQLGKYVGVAFDMKATDAITQLSVMMPMVGTDLPDPTYEDAFPKQCEYYTASNAAPNGGASCFAHYRKVIGADGAAPDNTLAPVGVWQRYCVLYSEVEIPASANAATIIMIPPFDPTQLLKVVWAMFAPGESGVAAPFDISIDNVDFLTAAQATDSANNCNLAKL